MRVVAQRCREAHVVVTGVTIGNIGKGLMLLVGIADEDTVRKVEWMADKLSRLRIFEDEWGKMNNSVLDVGGKILSVPQFTLYGDCRKGRRPNFLAAAHPVKAKSLYDKFNERLCSLGLEVETGSFGTMMDVHIINGGPVTFVIDS